jgi:YVTN family beta-propeller protein
MSLSVVASAEPTSAAASLENSQTNSSRIERKGVSVEFSATPSRPGRQNIVEGEFADIEFRIAGSEDGEPLQSVYPGVWIDLTQTADGQTKGTSIDCKTRVGQYLQGLVGMRPLIDLNSYYIMVLNKDPSISIIDPIVGITGITSLYANIPLTRPGADWTKTADEKTMFVSMPRAGQIAIVDLDTFKVEKNIDAGEMPMRIVLQPDEKYLWVGNDTSTGGSGGVTVIETESGETVRTIVTGKGHHEIAFSADSHTAFVSNRESGTMSVIDIASLEKVSDIEIGQTPISLAYSPLSKSIYVADGQTGEVVVVAAEAREVLTRISTSPGLGPMQFSEDGRWGFLVNPQSNMVYVIDASTDDVAHKIAMGHRPYQVGITRTFAYIRSLDSERISMINLQELNRGGQVIINEFAAGSFPPGQVNDISIADGMVPAAQEAAVLIVSPADATVYYYMEGMNAPMGAFRNYGHQPRAVQIANRALKEKQPGVYTATVKVPAAGTFEVAFLNETPQFLHCFTMQAEVNPLLKPEFKPVVVEYLNDDSILRAGTTMKLRFRLSDPSNGEVFADFADVRVKYYRAPRFGLTELLAKSVGDGIYEVDVTPDRAGAYYVYVAAPSLNAQYNDLNYLTMMASRVVDAGETAVGDTR